jgi:hypothetical protein
MRSKDQFGLATPDLLLEYWNQVGIKWTLKWILIFNIETHKWERNDMKLGFKNCLEMLILSESMLHFSHKNIPKIVQQAIKSRSSSFKMWHYLWIYKTIFCYKNSLIKYKILSIISLEIFSNVSGIKMRIILFFIF